VGLDQLRQPSLAILNVAEDASHRLGAGFAAVPQIEHETRVADRVAAKARRRAFAYAEGEAQLAGAASRISESSDRNILADSLLV
jgi:hypothetical protein